ncbi:Beta-xylosidase, GH43 family [Anaerocolumna jejuensis DSM 15929]|uniref:Beta-xylosidase, GH43 family n=1 Tax=Anaerocolumna jejuensis DSM 15929 TaxID=1121322 RepID=A0A1M6MP35_9FIRM|nr:CBM35 domain-containing protein [Anaerocolumna jejuensis]SHJ85241.1 Beta-xylosidase, GH43 family [Anaerocolumna jejuensis DSM 15929]
MRKKSLVILPLAIIFTLLLTSITYADVTSSYQNPLIRGADPTIARAADGYYYSCFSTGDGIHLQKHETILGVTTAKSRLVWPEPDSYGYVWGPYIYRLDGKWYIYFSSSSEDSYGFGHPDSYVLENSSPDPYEGTWVEKGKLNTQSNGLACGVVTLNGKRYFSYTKYFYKGDSFDECPTLVEMSNPWTLKGTEGTVAYPVNSWEKNGGSIDEGCAVVERNGKIYFGYSASSFMNDNYCVGISSAKSDSNLLDSNSWVKNPQPVMVKSPDNSAFGPGSPLFVKSEDETEDWIVYHAGPVGGQTGSNRWVRAQRINWNEDGFINLGIPSNPGTVLSRPSGEEKSETYEAEYASLSGASKVILSNSPNCSGSGYAQYNNNSNDYVEFTVNTEAAGSYSLNFRYNNNTAGNIPMKLQVNQKSSDISFGSNAGNKYNYDLLRINNVQLNAGSNKIRLTVSGKSGLALDALILKRSVMYEAENATLSGGATVAADHNGYTGTGFVAGLLDKGASAQFTVNAPYAGNYSVNLRYCNGYDTDKTLSIYVNDEKVKQIELLNYRNWDKWADRYDNITLKAGNNTITYKYDDDDSGNVNLDSITVTEAATWHYEAENAVLSGNAKIADNHSGYAGTGFIDGLWVAGSAVDFSVDTETAASYDVKLRYSNGNNESKTLSLYLNGSKVKQISLPKTGNWNTWSEKVETVYLNKGTNTITFKYDTSDSANINIDNIHLNKRVPWKYQAESSALSGGAKTATDHLWYDGTGFVAGFWQQGASTQFNVSVPNTASYTTTLRYSGYWPSKGNLSLSLYVNGTKVKQISLPQTASWDAWAESTEAVNLKAGNNIVEYRYDEGDTGDMNIDCITIDKYSGGNTVSNNSVLASGRIYKITAKHSGKSLDVSNYSSDEGALVNQWSYVGGNNQKWEISDTGSGYFIIKSAHSGRVLEVVGGSTENDANICQSAYVAGKNSQQWALEKVGDYYKIKNRNSGKVLDVSNISKDDGAKVHQWEYVGGENQLWKIDIP